MDGCAMAPQLTSSRSAIGVDDYTAGSRRGLNIGSFAAFDDREVIAHDRLVVDEGRIHAMAIEVEHERAEHEQRQRGDRMLQIPPAADLPR